MEIKHPHTSLIRALGVRAVRNTYGVTRQAMSKWYRRGVPHKHRHSFAKLCAMNGVHVPADFYDDPKEVRQ